ncbi:MAG TPA: BadF/BadG/BcrA/BcrD ATPase family protein [Candidatus Deferrimicrobiaceae bacterium]|nr:BadF/BadG/BcrA/BcrD ATPase family protein [Candidatus Deferrimicrobiaceae bacterium]
MIKIIVAYYLGIDGGGSKTICTIGDEVSVLASAVAGPSNITRVGESRARESLHAAIREACAAAKIDPFQFCRVCVGVAGVASEQTAQAVRKIIAEVISGEIEVVGDMQIALQAALGAEPGIVVIAGTGSIAYGRDPRGKTARAGGWGFAISDEGSAHWIGRMAVAGLLRAADKSGDDRSVQVSSPLFREVNSIWKVESFDELARAANSNRDFAMLLPAVVAAADSGDTVAEHVLTQAGRELADLAAIVARALFPEKIVTERVTIPLATIPLAMVGGVFRFAIRVREVFCNTATEHDPRFQVNRNIVQPVDGALRMARSRTSQPKIRI